MKPHKTFYKNVFIVFFIMVTSIVALEISLRKWLYRYALPQTFSQLALYEEVPEQRRLYSPHHYLNYYPTPNYVSYDGWNRHNSLGFRGDEVAVPKPKGIFRICVLGGSTAYTERVWNYKKSFPNLLQKLLREKYGYANAEVINAGVGGYGSHETLINFEFRVLDLEPDLIIVYQGTNDVHSRLVLPSSYRGDNSGRRKQWQIPHRTIWEKSLILRILNHKYHFSPVYTGLNAFVGAPTSSPGVLGFSEKIGGDPLEILTLNPPIYFERNLRNIIAIAHEHDIEVVLMTWAHSPLFKDYASTVHYQKGFSQNNEVVRKLAEQKGIPLLDFARMMPQDISYWADGRHVNEAGSLLKAQIVAQYLHKANLINEF